LADIAQQQQSTLTIVCANARMCFDIIAHPLAPWFGAALEPCWRLQTQYSSQSNSCSSSSTWYMLIWKALWWWLDDSAFQGICQGNGATQAVWFALTIHLVHMLYEFGHQTSICYAISLSTLCLLGLIYIDNCNLFCLAPLPSSEPLSVINQLQIMLTFSGQAYRPLVVTWQQKSALGV